jgi:hypothetical protein
MHEHVKRFQTAGTIASDSDFIRMRETYESFLITEMREAGYVPVLDLGPHWSTKYISDDKGYEFVITLYGVRVGKRRSWDLEGMTAEGTFYRKNTPKNK